MYVLYVGLCGSWDKNRRNDGGKNTVEKWRRLRADSLFFYKAEGGDVCLPKKLLCNKEKKFKAHPGWTNYVFPGMLVHKVDISLLKR